MKRSVLILLSLILGFTLSAGLACAQDADTASAETTQDPVELEPILGYSDYTVKAYSLTFFGGRFSGATYMENQKLSDRAVFTEGANDITAFDGNLLPESRNPLIWDAAHKKIEPGPAFGTRIGVYISDNFHLDLLGVYGTGTAKISMLQIETLDGDPNFEERRVELDSDDGFKMYKGGLSFQYDGNNAKVFGVRPRLGFGIGGVINRYSHLPDVTALYLDANFGLDVPLTKNLDISAGVEITTFAFEVEELGYNNMVSYNTFHIGLTYFIDVLPEMVRAEHIAEVQNRK